MTTNVSATLHDRMQRGLGISWGWMLALGILMTVLGVIGLGMTYWLTVVAMRWFGILTIIGGIAQILDAFHHKRWTSVIWHVIIAIIYIIAGFVLILMPAASAFWLTVFLAASFIVVGIMRIVMAFQLRQQGGVWVAVLLYGLVSILLGALIFGTVTPPSAEALATFEGQLAWIRSWGWVIGLFIAVELITEGVALISIALATKSTPAKDVGGGPEAKPAG